MIEYFELDDVSGYASIYDSHITLNKTLLKYFKDAYRVRVGVDKENKKIHISIISKDYALSGELKESSLLPISISKTYARICSRSLVQFICNCFHLEIGKKEFLRYKTTYDDMKKEFLIDLEEEEN